jgi:hypothetical protein
MSSPPFLYVFGIQFELWRSSTFWDIAHRRLIITDDSGRSKLRKVPILRRVTSRKSEGLIYTATEARNHTIELISELWQ